MPPAISAIGRFFFAFLSSAFIDVAIIQPSYANAVATTEPKRSDISPFVVAKFEESIETLSPAILCVKP